MEEARLRLSERENKHQKEMALHRSELAKRLQEQVLVKINETKKEVSLAVIEACKKGQSYTFIQLQNNSGGWKPEWAQTLAKELTEQHPEYTFGLRTISGTYTTYREYGCDGDYDSEDHNCQDLVLDISWPE